MARQAHASPLRLNPPVPSRPRILPVGADDTSLANDPFDDPFGDRSQPIEQPLEISSPQPGQPSTPIVEPTPKEPAPMRLAPIPTREETFPLQEILPDKTTRNSTNSQRIVDCQQLDCAALRKQLEQTSIRQISLNITPTFNPSIDDEPQQRQLESRTWTDNMGRALATGSLTDYQFNQVHIKNADGSITKLPAKQLSEKDLCYLADAWGIPVECPLNIQLTYSRDWTPLTFTWKASALCHKPLYFEQIQLERYGHTTGPFTQPFFSGGHFILNIAMLPYKMGINPINECQYSLGYYRPGSCAPWLISPVPLSLRGAMSEAATIFGGGALFP